MKKAFNFFAAMLAVAGMVTVASCEKPDNGKPNNNGNEPDDPETEALITIDGKFDDWAKAQGVVSTSLIAGNAGIVIDANNQRIDGLKTLKAVADEDYLYLYLEADMTVEYAGGTSWDGSPLGKAFAGPIDIYINADNDTATGGICWTYEEPAGWEYLYEAAEFFTQEPGAVTGYEFDMFNGVDGTDIWATDPPAKESVNREGLASAFTVKDGNTIKAEISFIRAFMPKANGSKLSLGVVQQSTNWTLHGLLPQVACEAGAFTAGKMLEVALP